MFDDDEKVTYVYPSVAVNVAMTAWALSFAPMTEQVEETLDGYDVSWAISRNRVGDCVLRTVTDVVWYTPGAWYR